MPSLSPKLKILSILARNYKNAVLNFSSGALIFTKSKVCLKYLVHDRLWKHFFALNFPKTHSRPESFDSFCNNVCSKILIKKKVNWKVKCFFAKIWLLLTFEVVSKDIKNKTKKLQIMMVAIFWDLIFSQSFKRNVITSNENRINEMPHELSNNLRFKKSQENIKTVSNCSLVPSFPEKMKFLSILVKNYQKK